MLLATHAARGILGHGPRITASKLVSARSVSSVPRLQAQVADLSSALDSNTNNVPPPRFNPMPVREAVTPPVRPVVSALPQNRDEFWRKVPLWRDVSTKEFLSYSWSVSLGGPIHEHGVVSHRHP
jgi:lysine 2,3-aminomutase